MRKTEAKQFVPDLGPIYKKYHTFVLDCLLTVYDKTKLDLNGLSENPSEDWDWLAILSSYPEKSGVLCLEPI